MDKKNENLKIIISEEDFGEFIICELENDDANEVFAILTIDDGGRDVNYC